MRETLSNNKVSIASFGLMLGLNILALFAGGFDHQVLYYVLFFILGLTLLSVLKGKKLYSLSIYHPLFWFSLFIIWNGISIFWSINPHRTLAELVQLILYGAVLFLASQLNYSNIFKVGRLVTLTSVGIALLGILQYIFVGPQRIQGTFTNANPFGIYLTMLFLLNWGYYLRQNSKITSGISLMLLTALILTGSRGSMLSLIIACPLLFIGFPKKDLLKTFGKTLLCIILAFLLAKVIMLVTPYFQEKNVAPLLIKSTLRTNSLANSTGGRFAFWDVGIELFTLKPLQGYGLGTFYLAYYLIPGLNKWYSRFVHNHYIQIASETGLIGLGIFLVFLFCLALIIKKKLHNGYSPFFPGIVAGLLAFLLHIGVDFSWNFPGVAVIFFAFAGIISKDSQLIQIKKLNLNYKIVTSIILVFLLLAGWQFTALQLYSSAINLTNQGRDAEAAQVYNFSNKFYPINPKGFSFESNSYLKQFAVDKNPQLLEKALESSQKALALCPVDSILQDQLGYIYMLTGDKEKAEKHFKLSIKYQGFLKAYINLGKLYLQQDQLKKAEKILTEGLEVKNIAIKHALERNVAKNETVELHLLLAEIYYRKGDLGLVNTQIEEAKKLNPEHPNFKKHFKEWSIDLTTLY